MADDAIAKAEAAVSELWLPEWDRDRGKSLPYRPLPVAVEEITAEWLTQALSLRAPGLLVRRCEVTRVKHGFTSLIWLTLDLNDAGLEAGVPRHIVVKGGFSPISERASFGYAMEGHSYRDVWPNMPLNMPRTYFVDLELATNQSITIMEDLNDRGVKFGHGLRPLGYEMQARRLSALAELHAKTWDSPDLKPGGRFHMILPNGVRLNRLHMELDGFVDMGREEFGSQKNKLRMKPAFLTPEGWETIWDEQISHSSVASIHFRDFEWNRQAILYTEALMDQLPCSIVHGDTHLANHFEEPDGTPGFFDPMPRREPPYFELAYTIITGCDPLDRRNWERGLIGHYVAEMARHGVKLGFNETMYYYAVFMHQGFIWFIKNDPMWQTTAFNTVNVWRHCAAMIDNGTKELIDAAIAGRSPA
jgi:hypothetical protein